MHTAIFLVSVLLVCESFAFSCARCCSRCRWVRSAATSSVGTSSLPLSGVASTDLLIASLRERRNKVQREVLISLYYLATMVCVLLCCCCTRAILVEQRKGGALESALVAAWLNIQHMHPQIIRSDTERWSSSTVVIPSTYHSTTYVHEKLV